MFFYLSKRLFLGFFQFQGNYVLHDVVKKLNMPQLNVLKLDYEKAFRKCFDTVVRFEGKLSTF